MSQIEIGPWRPDLAKTTPGFAIDVLNVLPIQGSEGVDYAPLKKLANPVGAAALSAAPRGAAAVFKNDGSTQVFVGTGDNIYKLEPDYSWTAIGTGTFAVPTGDDWSFAHFGDYLIATNSADGMWQYNISTGGPMTQITDAPAAKYVFVTNNLLVALQCDGDSGLLMTSDFNDHTNWTTGAADSQQFPEGGALMGGADLANQQAVILQKNAVRRMDFSGGGGVIFSLRTISAEIGTTAPKSIVSHGGLVFFLGLDGFWKTDGAGVAPISAGKIATTFMADTSPDDRIYVQGGVDPINRVIWWRYKSLASVDVEIYQDMVGYQWELGEWTRSDFGTYGIFTLATPATDLDSITTPLDSLTRSLDSYYWLGGGRNVAVIDENYKVAFLTGDNAQGKIETHKIATGGAPMVREIEPETDCAIVTVQIGTGETAAATLSWSSEYSVSDGVAYTRDRGRYMAFRLNFPEDAIWSTASGFNNMRASAGGRRQ